MDYDKLADVITERTKVIVPVDIAGICADVDKVREIVNRPEILAKFHPANDIQKLLGRIAISNDCAHSFGASRHGKMAGEIADFSSFSFHAVKNFTTAEGGALTWNLPFGNEKVERQQVYCGSPIPFIEGETWNEFIYRLSQLFSPTNNDSEKALRPAKTKLKVSGRFRTESGAENYATVIQTAVKNGQNPFSRSSGSLRPLRWHSIIASIIIDRGAGPPVYGRGT